VRARRGHGLGAVRARSGARLGRGHDCGGVGHDLGMGAAAATRRRRSEGVGTVSERVRKKKSLPVLCASALPSARDLALGKDFFNFKIRFAECQIEGTWQRRLCRVVSGRHLAKVILQFFAECRPGDTRQRLLCRCHFWTLGKVHFYFFLFSQPKFLWCVLTLYRPTCTILKQLEKCFL
jgi:hypothetical protein